MSDAPLDPNELEAIQDAVREAQGSVNRPTSPSAAFAMSEDVLPLALIADDRVAETARPAAMRLAERWAELAGQRLKHVLKGEVDIKVVSAEVVDGGALREELEHMWTSSLRLSDRPGTALVAVGGPMISGVAARLLGAVEEEGEDDERPPTRASLKIFEPVGRTLVDTLVIRWEGQDRCRIEVNDDEAHTEVEKRALCESDVVVAVTMSVDGPVKGRIRLLGHPSVMVPPPKLVEAVPAAPGAIEYALGQVNVEIRVELGRARLSMAELKQIRPGTILMLGQFVDDPLPVECSGVVKAYGRAVVTRGVLAVEVVGNVSGRGASASLDSGHGGLENSVAERQVKVA